MGYYFLYPNNLLNIVHQSARISQKPYTFKVIETLNYYWIFIIIIVSH